jgi:hypothetical protein
MEMTLNKANKLLQKLAQHKGTFSNTHSISSISFKSVDLEADGDSTRFKNTITNTVAAKTKSLNDEFLVLEDISNLKEALFSKNITAGVSPLMRKKELNQTTLSKLRSLLSDLDSDSVVSNDQVTDSFIKAGQTSESRYDRFAVSLVSKEEIEKRIFDLTQEVNDIEDKILALNATTRLEITLSEPSQKILGLK